MHELSLMQSVTELIKDSANQNRINKISKVRLVVGNFSMAMPDSLRFAFEVISSVEPLFDGAVLEIETRSIVCQCLECERETILENDYHFVCSHCGSVKVEVIQGRELYLDYYEGE